MLAPAEDLAPCQGLGKLEQTGQGLNKGATNHIKYIHSLQAWVDIILIWLLLDWLPNYI